MKKILILLILLTFVAVPGCSDITFALSSSIENNTHMGKLYESYLVDDITAPIDEQLRDLQQINSEQIVQVGTKEVLIEEQKSWILNRTSLMWEMIGGLFLLIFEVIKSLFYVIEMYIFFLFVFKIIPNIIIKVKDGVIGWYTNRFLK